MRGLNERCFSEALQMCNYIPISLGAFGGNLGMADVHLVSLKPQA